LCANCDEPEQFSDELIRKFPTPQSNVGIIERG